MPGPKPEAIDLSDQVRHELEKLVARHTTGQQKAHRARIILKAAEGKNNADIARELKQSIDMVRLWRRRWHELEPIGYADLSVEERLEDLPRPGAPARLSLVYFTSGVRHGRSDAAAFRHNRVPPRPQPSP